MVARLVAQEGQSPARSMGPRQTVELTAAESWQLLESVPLGRIVFTHHAMPAVRPVNHVVDGHTIVIRSHLGAAIAGSAATEDGTVVCYEADDIDVERHTGWSVIATGTARLVHDPDVIARYEQQLVPWVERSMDYFIAITPRIITGLRLVGWCR
jgi:nitroimidazol reductase NimA-like FMN-containing flavoprotein (pyridoxamine 5'-phosphate oxidase superfamily)